MKKRRGVGRLLGSTIGFLVGGPAGAAIGVDLVKLELLQHKEVDIN